MVNVKKPGRVNHGFVFHLIGPGLTVFNGFCRAWCRMVSRNNAIVWIAIETELSRDDCKPYQLSHINYYILKGQFILHRHTDQK